MDDQYQCVVRVNKLALPSQRTFLVRWKRKEDEPVMGRQGFVAGTGF